MIATSCFLPHQKILILAEVMAGWRSAIMCNCIARAIFNREYLNISNFELQNESTPPFFEQSSSYLAVMFFGSIRKDCSEWIFDLGLKIQNTDNSVLSWLSVTVVKYTIVSILRENNIKCMLIRKPSLMLIRKRSPV